MPSLLWQGLLEPQQQKVVGLFETTRYRYTAAGLAQKERLEQQMTQSSQTASLLKDDPPQLAALLYSLGSAAILVPELWPYFGEINARFARQDDRGSLVPIFIAGSHDPDPSCGTFSENRSSLIAAQPEVTVIHPCSRLGEFRLRCTRKDRSP